MLLGIHDCKCFANFMLRLQVLGWGFIKLDDSSAADYSLAGPRAAELLHSMKSLLKHGGLFLSEASETLTHCALNAMKGKVIFYGPKADKAAVLCWPALDSEARRRPLQMARSLLGRVKGLVN